MKSVSNAIRTLLLLSEHGPLGVVDLSVRLGVAKSTAHRLLTTMSSFDFVAQEAKGQRYRIGEGFADLAFTHNSQERLLAASRRELERAAEATGETTNLVVLRGPDAVFVDGVEGSHPLRIATRTGDRIPAYSSAGGKLLLSELAPEEVYRLYPRSLYPRTPSTLSNSHILVAHLAKAREQGYAVTLNECLEGVSAIAVGVTDTPRRVIAAVTISLPSARFSKDRVVDLLKVLRNTAADIAENLVASAGVLEQ